MEKLFSIKLRKIIDKNDALKLIDWLSDEEVTKYMNEDSGVINILHTILDEHQDPLLTYYLNQSSRFFMVDYDGKPVGFASLKSLGSETSEIVIAIGKKRMWGRKLGHYALIHLLGIANEQYNQQKFIVHIHKENKRSIGLFEHLGFVYTKSNGDFLKYEYNN